MKHVGIELRKIAADSCGDGDRKTVFGSAWDRNGGNVDEIACGGEGRVLDRRRVNAHLRSLAKQIVDEPIKRLVGAIANVIVIA